MKVAFLGDLALFSNFNINNNDGLECYFSEIKKVLDECDLVVANLEAPFYEAKKNTIGKTVLVSSDKCNVELLKYLNISLVNLANNHIADFGVESINETIDCLDSHNIGWFGVRGKSFDFDMQNNRLCFNGFCAYNTDSDYLGHKKGINALKYKDVFNFLSAAEKQNRYPIVSVHSGVENVFMPSVSDMNLARQLAKDFDYFYYGHHPHVLQGYEEVDNSKIAYSLGNFVFDDIYDTQGNLIVKQSEHNKSSVVLVFNFVNSQITSKKVIGIQLGTNKLNTHHQPSVDMFNMYSEYLKLNLKEYQTKRNSMVSLSRNVLRSKRDLKYYFSRLSIFTLIRIVKRKINKFKQFYYLERFFKEKNG